jgi:two-component system sensor histidine kinase TorS
MSARSYVKPAPGRRFGLRERLLLALLFGALATVLVAVVGWVSFQRVVGSQQAIIRDTLPAADALHEAVRGNARLAALAPRLARVESVTELNQLRTVLAAESTRIRERLAALQSPHVEPELRTRLQATGEALSVRLEAMGETIGTRLALRAARTRAAAELREAIDALDTLARMHTENATALLVTTLTSLLQPAGDTARAASPATGPSAAPLAMAPDTDRNAARDRLLDLDLDTLERMHELTLTVHALAFLIDRLDEVDSAEPLQSARTDFAGHLALLDRRVRDIPDPAARAQGRQLHDVLAKALASGGAVDLRSLEIELRARSDGLQNEVGSLTTELDALAGELIHRGGRILASAGSAAERSATSGLIAFGVIAAALLLVTAGVSWYVLRRHTLGRLLDLEQATLALAVGQRDVVIDTTGDDEIASLSRALERFRNDAIERDRLAEALRLQQQDLENQVLARTAELREANTALAHETAEHATARVAAEKADHAKTAFLGTVSHELRTPMAGILGLLELLETSPPAAERTRYLAQMRAAATLLLELLEDMLDFARIEAGGVHLDALAFSLHDAVNDVFAVQGTRAAARGLALVADIDPAVADVVVGDRRKLSQILLNLVGNAIKFSDEGAVTVRVSPGARPDVVRFAVTDHGIGIDAARQAEVFEPFVQVRDSGRHHAGTGLGLAVCRRLVRAMGGEVGLVSAPGQGTTVSFELILPPAPSLPGAEAGPALDAEPAPLAPGHRVLVVEDDEVNRMVVERFLDALGQQPLCVADIQGALHALGEQAVDIALIDMNLPDGDGREMLARMRALAPHADTPAVLMSAHIPAHQVDGLLAAGFGAFLSKPFARERLGAVLAGLLAGAAPQADAARASAPAAEAVHSSAWVDRDFLRAEEAALGRAVVDDIVEVFRTQGQTLVAALIAAAEAGDAEQCARLAHKLRGAAFNLGLERLGNGAASLEQQIGQIEAEGKLALRVQDLVGIYGRTMQALAETLDAAPGRPDADEA